MSYIKPDDLLAGLRKFRVPVIEHSGWRTRANKGDTSLDARFMVVHDSVTGAMNAARACSYCMGEGHSRGVLYEAIVADDGVHLIAFGLTYHAGVTNASRVEMARASKVPFDRRLGSPPPDDYRNANLYGHGIAFLTAGAGPYEPRQPEWMARTLAGYATAHGWSPGDAAGSTIGHGELTSRKVDPKHDIAALRRRVRALLAAPTLPFPWATEEPEPTAAQPYVNLGRVRTAFANRQDDVTNDTEQIQRALAAKLGVTLRTDGIVDEATVKAYAQWQRKCGFSGDAANGIPGKTTLERLGFRVG